jgi:hypothetical protein
MKIKPPVDLGAKKYDILAGGHSIFSPSSSAMWLWCAGSLLPNLTAKDDAGEEAAEGTVAHHVAEHWLKTGVRPKHLVGTTMEVDGWTIEITNSMLDYVELYVDWCMECEGDHYTETKVWFSDLTPIPKQGGTSDHGAIFGRTITVTDLKFGKGVIVYAAEDLNEPAWCWRDEFDNPIKLNGNTQALLYAYGFYRSLSKAERDDIKYIRIRICQPRLGHFQTWETTVGQLLDFAAWVKERAALAWQENAPRRVSEKGCQWCRVKGTCAAFAAAMEELNGSVFDDVETSIERMEEVKDALEVGLYAPKLLPPGELSTLHLSRLVAYRGIVESWFRDVEAELDRRALRGEPVPGQKLVEARTNRVFKNQKAAERFLHKQGVDTLSLYKLSFASPAQAEDALVEAGFRRGEAVKLLAPHVDKPRGRATLVPLSDPRQPLDAVADEVFSDLTAEDL